jgi:hypothetical protein
MFCHEPALDPLPFVSYLLAAIVVDLLVPLALSAFLLVFGYLQLAFFVGQSSNAFTVILLYAIH